MKKGKKNRTRGEEGGKEEKKKRVKGTGGKTVNRLRNWTFHLQFRRQRPSLLLLKYANFAQI